MAQEKRVYRTTDQLALQLRIQSSADPAVSSYIASLKRRFRRYVMPIDEARKVIDEAMGTRTLTELLYEARQQAG